MVRDPVLVDRPSVWYHSFARYQPFGDLPRDQFVAFAAAGLSGSTATQHLSTDHHVTLDATDPDRATATSTMYARHHLAGAPGGEAYVVRGSSTHRLRRTGGTWRIEHLTQHVSWLQGDPDAPAQAAALQQQAATPS